VPTVPTVDRYTATFLFAGNAKFHRRQHKNRTIYQSKLCGYFLFSSSVAIPELFDKWVTWSINSISVGHTMKAKFIFQNLISKYRDPEYFSI
jgi:hypothetical protein